MKRKWLHPPVSSPANSMGLIFAHKEVTRQGVQKTMMQVANYCNGERGRDGGGSNKKHKGSLSFRGDASLCQSLPPKKSSTWVKLGHASLCHLWTLVT